MTALFVRSTDGLDTDTGLTWALAKATLTGAAAIDAAGDVIYVSDNHAESTAAAVTLAFAGTIAAPVRVLCVDDLGDPSPPTALATTGTVTTTGANSITINGSVYVYGLTFNGGSGVGAIAVITLANAPSIVQVYERCAFVLVATNASNAIRLHNSTAEAQNQVVWINCDVKFANAAHRLSVRNAIWHWKGGSVLAGGTTPTGGMIILGSVGTLAEALIENVDFSNCDAAVVFFAATAAAGGEAVMRNCKLPAGWTGTLVAGAPAHGSRVAMYNCDSGDTNYKVWIEQFTGTIRDETAVVRTGTLASAKHNAVEVPLANRFVTTTDANYPSQPLYRDVALYNETTGTAVTATFSLLSFTSAALNNNDIAAEVMHLATSGSTLGSRATSLPTGVLTAPSALAADTGKSWDSKIAAYSAATDYAVGDIVRPSTANGAIYRCEADAGTTAAEPTWGTTDGGTTVDGAGRTWRRCRRQAIAVSYTPAEQGPVSVRLSMYLASTTVYVDPVPVLT